VPKNLPNHARRRRVPEPAIARVQHQPTDQSRQRRGSIQATWWIAHRYVVSLTDPLTIRYMVPWSLTPAAGSAFNAGYPSYVLAFDPDWSAPPPICTYPGTGAPCPCDRNQRCAPPAGSAAGADPFNCTDIANGQSCTCGSTITCGLTRNPQPQPQLLCHDSQTNQSCTCRSSLTCISSPPGPRPSCFIQASKAPCDCADMATNANCQKAN